MTDTPVTSVQFFDANIPAGFQVPPGVYLVEGEVDGSLTFWTKAELRERRLQEQLDRIEAKLDRLLAAQP